MQGKVFASRSLAGVGGGAPRRAAPGPVAARGRRPLPIAATEGKDEPSAEGSGVEDAFRRELERRRVSSIDDLDADGERDRRAPPVRRAVPPPPPFAKELTGQLERSRRLNSEGLEGLPARASQLLQLGVTSFLAFGPFIAAVALATAAVYAAFGGAFIHGGTPAEYSAPPPRYDAEQLLREPTVDPMVPLL